VWGFRVCFIPLAGCFSPFPHGTCSLSVALGSLPWRVVPPASHKIARVSWYSGSRPTGLVRPLRDSHPLWCGLPTASSEQELFAVGPTTPVCPERQAGLGMIPVRSPLLRDSRLITFRRATEMFQFAHCPPADYGFISRSPDITLEGLPHSDTPGSSLACSSPGTFRRSPRPSSAQSARASTPHAV
jgi:hypothetical protein